MDDYKDDLISESHDFLHEDFAYEKSTIHVQPSQKNEEQKQIENPDEEEEEEESSESVEYTPSDYIKLLYDECDTIMTNLSGVYSSFQEESLKRVIFYAKSKSPDVFQKLFEFNIMATLNDIYGPLVKSKILTIIQYLTQTKNEEVILHFMEMDIFNYLIEMVYEEKEEDIPQIIPIFVNIIETSPLTAGIFYSTGILFNASNALEDHTITSPYSIAFVSIITDYFVKNRISHETAESLANVDQDVRTSFPGIKIDPLYFRDYVQIPFSLKIESPFYGIIQNLLKTDQPHEIIITVIHTLLLFASIEIDWGYSCIENCNIILNDIGYISEMSSLIQRRDLDLSIQVMNLNAQLLYHSGRISSQVAEEMCSAIDSAISQAIDFNSTPLQKLTIYVIGSLVDYVSNDSDIFIPENITFITNMANSEVFSIKTAASYALLRIAYKLNDFDCLTFNFLENLSSLLDAQPDNRKIQWLSLIEQMIQNSYKDEEQLNFVSRIKDAELYDTIVEMLDDENEEIQEKAQNIVDIFNENDESELLEFLEAEFPKQPPKDDEEDDDEFLA